ncbi:uncharacterized protein LOC122061159 isoform X2 [Macadamia integrifolia]|uniref:uncharacterized protein LOC122061159 isoform X2 n=1 Tax=Macadamia integrifolia TaxID=60698 RepID=UPI001C528CD9|nr:uncharacterized protein LOC122061159 isoform X2 [Macadamia integrifolia]
MGDVKSWIVTYTKHIKQKRKVYQDGVLEIHGSTNKVMLFDDSGKLLECRLMKEEVIGSGETLAFDSYLVDIGDPKGSHEHFTNLNTQERKPNGTNRIFHGQKARNILTFSEKRTDVGNTGAAQDCPNVTKNITREYKKSELEFNAPKSHQNTTKTTVTEWHALYTTQTTKKAKKYHDGFLRLSICGSQGRQVMLYDESRKLLDTRFLKKDEVIGPGETLAFDAHLVDVGDPEGNHSPLKDLNFKGEDTKVIEKTRTAHEQKARYCSSVENGNKELKNSGSLQSHANPAQTSVKEWNALYTTQITQKAKKFHDGILQLTFCNPRGKQVILLDEDGTKLSNKYIKFSEDVITGSVLEVTNYLVEIGEPRQLQGGKSQENASSREGISSNSSNYIANNLGVSRSTRLPDGKSQKNASSGEGVRSNSSTYIDDNLGSSRSTQLRDAKQIMSILKKPMAQESLVHARNVPVEQSHSSHPSYLVQSGAQDQPPAGCSHGSKFFERNESDDHEYDPKNLNGARTASFNTCRSGSLESKEAQDDLVVDITNLMDHNHRISTFDCSLRAAAPNISPKPDLGYTDKRTVKTAQSIAEPQASDVIVLNLPEDTLPSEFSGPRSQVPKDINVTSNQHLDSIRIGTQWGKKTSLMGLSNSLTGSASFFSTDDERESSEVQNIPKQIVDIGELPSFDLGI